MKNIRLFIKCKNLDMLQAFSDEVYLYDYIVNNYSELPEENIFRNPNVSFYAVILDPENGSFTIYDNLKASIPYLQINSNTDVFEAVKKIEQFNKGLEYEEEMEM